MVSIAEIRASNSRIASALPPGLVAVFVGATSGIGETSLKQFAKFTRQPRVYFIGRSQEAADRIANECKQLNSEGEYTFLKADTSLIRTVDDACRDIKGRENAINLLFLSQGTLKYKTETSEGLHYAAALVNYSRARFIVNLLPLLQQATALRRVVSVFAAGKEGPIDITDFQSWKVPLLAARGHASSLVTVSLAALAEKAPDVTFIHNFPGAVKTNLIRGDEGIVISALGILFKIIGPMFCIPFEECGERHLFFATSARYPASTIGDVASGVPTTGGVTVARGIDGKSGSGVYSIDQNGESSGPKVEELLAKFKTEGVIEKVWKDIEEEFKRITSIKMA